MVEGKVKPKFKRRKIADDDLYGKKGYTLYMLRPNVWQFMSKGAGSHVYLILGDNLNVIIDSGYITKFNSFNYLLTQKVGINLEDIDLVICTHEHFDHISAIPFFPCPIAAHRWAATKIKHDDELILNAKKHSIDLTHFHIDYWLEDRNIFDLGGTVLKIIETPGHTSGSICIYEPYERYIFTGDMLFSGVLSNVYESGSISEMIQSLQILNTLKIDSVFPGHGKCITKTQDVQDQIDKSLDIAKCDLSNYIGKIKSGRTEDLVIPPSLYKRDED